MHEKVGLQQLIRHFHQKYFILTMIFLSLSTILRLHDNGTKPQHQHELMCFTAVQKLGKFMSHFGICLGLH